MLDRAPAGSAPPPPVGYRETPPPPALARAVFCRWTMVVGETADHVQRVLPDGCVDLVWVAGSAPFAAGPATRTDEARLPPGAVVVGLRFRPGWASLGLGAPASDLLDRDVKLVDLWSAAAQPRVEGALGRLGPHRLADRSALVARAHLDALERALAARAPLERPPDPLPAVAAAWLARHPSGRIDELARELAMSARQLQRRFAAAVGYGPKTFQRIARFQRLLAIASPPSGTRPLRLGELALDAGYADQAHMTREVGELSGRPPTQLVGVAGSALAGADLFAAPADQLTGTTRGRR